MVIFQGVVTLAPVVPVSELLAMSAEKLKCATSCSCRGPGGGVIAHTTGHKCMTVQQRYIREGKLFNENAASAVGL